jgi:hypothetical protein
MTGQVNAIESEFANNGVAMTLIRMARCFARILALMQVKSAGAEREDVEGERNFQMNDYPGMSSFMFMIHVVLLAMAFAWGYRLGQAHGAAPARLAVRGVQMSTNTYENDIVVGLKDLTVDALRSRLRELHCSPSGTKLELEARLEAAMHAQRLRFAVPR